MIKTVTLILEKSDKNIGPMTQQRLNRIHLASAIKRLYAKYQGSWMYYYSPRGHEDPSQVPTVVGDISSFDEAREI